MADSTQALPSKKNTQEYLNKLQSNGFQDPQNTYIVNQGSNTYIWGTFTNDGNDVSDYFIDTGNGTIQPHAISKEINAIFDEKFKKQQSILAELQEQEKREEIELEIAKRSDTQIAAMEAAYEQSLAEAKAQLEEKQNLEYQERKSKALEYAWSPNDKEKVKGSAAAAIVIGGVVGAASLGVLLVGVALCAAMPIVGGPLIAIGILGMLIGLMCIGIGVLIDHNHKKQIEAKKEGLKEGLGIKALTKDKDKGQGFSNFKTTQQYNNTTQSQQTLNSYVKTGQVGVQVS